MGFNGIKGVLNAPGMIPWEIVVIYFLGAVVVALYLGKKTGGLRTFKTIDLVYIGIGGALMVVWDFYIGSFLNRFFPSTPFIDFGFWGRLIITFVIAALVRKVGAGMATLFVYNLLGDIFHYGFGGEPMYFIYEVLTYGLFLDIALAATGGNLFPISRVKKAETNGEIGNSQVSKTETTAMNMIKGGILGATFALPDPLFYSGFIGPFLYGGYVNWERILFHIGAFLPGDIVAGVLAALIAMRILRVVR